MFFSPLFPSVGLPYIPCLGSPLGSYYVYMGSYIPLELFPISGMRSPGVPVEIVHMMVGTAAKFHALPNWPKILKLNGLRPGRLPQWGK